MRPADTPDELRRLASTLAADGGAVALAGRRAVTDLAGLEGSTKSTSTDLVTQFDRAAHDEHGQEHRTRHHHAVAGDAIVGEEGTADEGDNGYAWYIDPIDGTTSFVYDQPTWACSVGVARDGVMVAGAVFLPVLDELFSAAAGEGATRNGETISVSATKQLELALIATGFSYHSEVRRQQATRIAAMMSEIRDVRRTGSAAVDLCFVACGRVDAYFEIGLNPWDSAAGELIAHEAGAITTDFDGKTARPEEMLAATPGVHAALVELLRRT
jgi:myo-inositol-1(or 4)-monophosphatase